MRWKWLKIVLQYGIGLALLGFLVYRYWEPDPARGGVGLKTALTRDLRWQFLAPALLCLTISLAVTIIRWYALLQAQEIRLGLRDALRWGLAGYFFNTFLPGSVGGDLIKIALIARLVPGRRTVASFTVLIDRAVGLWGLFALTAVVGLVAWRMDVPVVSERPEMQRIVSIAASLLGFAIAFWLSLGVLPERRAQRFAQRLLWVPKIGWHLSEVWLAVWLYRSRRLSIVQALLLSMLGHFFGTLSFFFAALVFQPANEPAAIPDVLGHFVIVPVGLAFQAFIPTPGGVGGGELVFAELYKMLGFPGENGLFASLGYRVNTWILGFAGYVLYLTMKRELQLAAAPAEEETPQEPAPGA